jgi:hypothetical protein
LHGRTRQGATAPPPNFGKPWKFGQMLGKIKKTRAGFNLSENIMLKSGYFITILHKNSGKLSTAPLKASAPYAYAHLHGILIRINCKKKGFTKTMKKVDSKLQM